MRGRSRLWSSLPCNPWHSEPGHHEIPGGLELLEVLQPSVQPLQLTFSQADRHSKPYGKTQPGHHAPTRPSSRKANCKFSQGNQSRLNQTVWPQLPLVHPLVVCTAAPTRNAQPDNSNWAAPGTIITKVPRCSGILQRGGCPQLRQETLRAGTSKAVAADHHHLPGTSKRIQPAQTALYAPT